MKSKQDGYYILVESTKKTWVVCRKQYGVQRNFESMKMIKGAGSMGIYFNPDNDSFRQAKNSLVYVDKSGLLEMLNKKISTEDKCIALSHARRFGKSHAAGMIDAYYKRG